MSNYVTAIGLDVHARSIKACALNPMTGEVERASFGYDPASVAEWALGSQRIILIPKPPPGFPLLISGQAGVCHAVRKFLI